MKHEDEDGNETNNDNYEWRSDDDLMKSEEEKEVELKFSFLI